MEQESVGGVSVAKEKVFFLAGKRVLKLNNRFQTLYSPRASRDRGKMEKRIGEFLSTMSIHRSDPLVASLELGVIEKTLSAGTTADSDFNDFLRMRKREIEAVFDSHQE